MANFLDSELINKLEDGELPTVGVKVETLSIITISIALILTALIIILAARLTK
jgi:hypothetical protein